MEHRNFGERPGHLTANQVGYHLFDRRMES